MTREEAIEVLKTDGCSNCSWGCVTPTKCENKECPVPKALEMAISALEKEPLDEEKFKEYLDEIKQMDFREAIIKVMAMVLPDMDLERSKKGHWEKSDIPNEKYVCSECGGACWYYDYEGTVAKSKFCPNCGAKMGEPQGREE